MHTVVETPGYLSDAESLGLTEGERFAIVTFLGRNPEAGDVIRGAGGARKIRFAGKARAADTALSRSIPAQPFRSPVECATLKRVLGAITASYAKRRKS